MIFVIPGIKNKKTCEIKDMFSESRLTNFTHLSRNYKRKPLEVFNLTGFICMGK